MVSISGGVVSTAQSGVSGESHQIYVSSPGGTTTSWTVGADIALPRGASAGVGVVSTGLMTSRQPSRYGMTFNEDRRDLFVDGYVRWRVPAARLVALEPLAGITVAHRRHWSQTEYLQFYLMPNQQLVVDPRSEGATLTSFGAVLGLQMPVGTAHFAVVPSVNARLLAQERVPGWYPDGGPARFSVSFGLVARVGLGAASPAPSTRRPQ